MARKIFAAILVVMGLAVITCGLLYFFHYEKASAATTKSDTKTEVSTETAEESNSDDTTGDTVTIITTNDGGEKEKVEISQEEFDDAVKQGSVAQGEDGNWYYEGEDSGFDSTESEYNDEFYVSDQEETEVVDDYYTDDRTKIGGAVSD